MTKTATKWIGEFDLLRGFAILAIVTIHAGAFYNTIDASNIIVPIVSYLTHLADFGVPVFFFVSGFVLTLRYFDASDMKGFYRRRLSVIILPYLAFSALYLIYNFITIPDYTTSTAAWSVVLFNTTGIFWFIAVLLQFYILFPLLTRWQRSSEQRGRGWEMLAVSTAAYVAWYAFLLEPVAAAIDSVAQPVPGFGDIVAGRIFIGFLPFFALGIWAQRSPSWESWVKRLGSPIVVPIVLLLAVLLTVLGSGFWWYMLVLPFSALMLGPLYRMSRWLLDRKGVLNGAFRTMGTYSYGIYLIHILVIAVIVNRLWSVGIFADQWIFYVILLVGTMVLSIAALFVLNLLPFGPLLTGMRARTRARKRPADVREARQRQV